MARGTEPMAAWTVLFPVQFGARHTEAHTHRPEQQRQQDHQHSRRAGAEGVADIHRGPRL